MALAVITGASGLLGGNLAAALVAQGWTVRATRRGTTQVDHLDDVPIEWVPGELDQPDALASAFRGADAVFHCAAMVSILPKVTPAIQRANVDGTAHVLSAMRTSGARRLVHVSSVVAVGLTVDGQPSTEDARWNLEEERLADGYAVTKRDAEALVRAATDIDAVIVNPSYMLGPRDVRPSSGGLIIKVAQRKLPGWTPGVNDFVDVRDVARGMIAAAERGVRGERYILGGESLTYRDVFATMARLAGVAPPRFGVARPIAMLFGYGGDAWHRLTGKEPVVNSTQVRWSFTPRFRFSSAKAERVLGYQHGPIEPAIADAIAWFRARGMM